MKKGVKLLIFSIVPIILLTSLVAAISPAPPVAGTNLPANPFQGISDLLTGLLKVVGDIFGALTGDTPLGLDALVFTRMLLFVLLTAVLYMPAKIFAKNSTTIPLIVSSIVALLGARFLSNDLLIAVLLPYGVLAVALSCLIPLILYGVFINTSDFPGWVRKLGWYFFAAAFLGLYIWRTNVQLSPGMGEVGLVSPQGQMLYALFAGAAIIGAIVDSKLYQKVKFEKIKSGTSDEAKRTLNNELNQLKTEYDEKLKEYKRTPLNEKHPGMIKELDDLKKRIKEFELLMSKEYK